MFLLSQLGEGSAGKTNIPKLYQKNPKAIFEPDTKLVINIDHAFNTINNSAIKREIICSYPLN